MWKPKERLRIAQEVAQRLQGEILAGRYQPGEKLPPERRLSESLGINRATVREAMKHLEHLGLVRIRQGDGTRVLDFLQTSGLELLRHLAPSVEDSGYGVLRDVLELRQIVGREVARLAAERARPEQLERLAAIASQPAGSAEEVLQRDLEFYVELARATGNLVLSLLLNTVRGTVRSLAGLFAELYPEPELVRAHHVEVLAALRARDGEAACRASDRYLLRGKEHLLRRLEEGPEVRVRGDAEERP